MESETDMLPRLLGEIAEEIPWRKVIEQGRGSISGLAAPAAGEDDKPEASPARGR